MPTPTVLLVSSDDSLMDSVRGILSSIEGLRLEIVATIDEAPESIEPRNVVLALAHLQGIGGVAEVDHLLQRLAGEGHSIPTLVISDRQNASLALSVLQLGVADYLTRPLDLGRLAHLVDVLTLRARSIVTRPPVHTSEQDSAVVLEGDRPFLYSPATPLGRIMEQVRRIAPLDSTILLGGETGTGKTQLAGMIHRLSPRRDQPFLTINCGAMSANLVESEMFGHVKGAFTGANTDRIGKFAEVGKGTLFLDEVDSLPLDLQAKLLRAVEERVFEPVGSNKSQPMQARLVAACNRPLEDEVAAGRFRSDLFYRINVFAFIVPPLRERTWALPHLTRSFINEFSGRFGCDVHGISLSAQEALAAHNWPGNVRELRNVIERAVALCSGTAIQLEDLPSQFQAYRAERRMSAPQRNAPSSDSLAKTKDEAECYRIVETLGRFKNNRLRTAAELGISRMTLYNKLHKYGLTASA